MKLHSPWQGPYIVLIGDVTYCNQAEANPRKKIFNTSTVQNSVVYLTWWISRMALISLIRLLDQTAPVRGPRVPPLYLPDKTDLMYLDEPANVEVRVPESPERFQEPQAAVNDQPVHVDRLRREVRPPTWMRDYVYRSVAFLVY